MQPHRFFRVTIVLVWLIIGATQGQLVEGLQGELFEGGVCTLLNGAQGQCKSINECPSIDLRNSIRNTPPVCTFNQRTPIICCVTNNNPATTNKPQQRTQTQNANRRRTTQSTVLRTTTTSSTTPSGVGDKSAAMCDYFSQFVYQFVQSPTLMVNPEYYNESMCATREHSPNQTPLRDVEEALYKEFPHVASLGYGNESDIKWLCAGSLISERFILTTARCITSPNNGPVRWVRVGDLSPRLATPDSATIQTVAERIKHEGYRESSPPLNDIALLRLEKDVSFHDGIARPACLYTRPGIPPGHNYATAAGWGMTAWNDTTTTATLMKKDLTLLTASQCASPGQRSNIKRRQLRRSLQRLPTDSIICVTDTSPEPASCVGDSGGPLQVVLDTHHCMHAIVGLTSFGPRACVNATKPAVYTRVSSYISWIENHVWPASDD